MTSCGVLHVCKRRSFFFRSSWVPDQKRSENAPVTSPGFVTYFFFTPWNKMESNLENGCLCSPLRHTPHWKRRRGGEVSHVYGKCTHLGSLILQLMTLQLKLYDDKIPKNYLIAVIRQQGDARQEKDILKKKRRYNVDPSVKMSWPGFLLVACEGLSSLYREITNSFF